MKITLCGSIKFADKLVEVYRELEKLGHQPMPSPPKFLRNLGGQEGNFLVE